MDDFEVGMTTDSRDLEILVAKIQKQLAPKAEVLHNVKLDGRLSKTKRQIDVLVRERIGQYEIQIIIDCKDFSRPVDVKGVEEFEGLFRDVGAQKGVLVCPKGFTDAAKVRAEGLQIDLYSPVDTDVHKWQARVTIPALCDFRSAAMSFQFSSSAPVPFQLAGDFYSTSMMFDSNGNQLGTALNNALRKWNDGQFLTEVGAHEHLNIFKTLTVFMDNGYEPPLQMRVPADIREHLAIFLTDCPRKRPIYIGIS